jgi:hypothetical protein
MIAISSAFFVFRVATIAVPSVRINMLCMMVTML